MGHGNGNISLLSVTTGSMVREILISSQLPKGAMGNSRLLLIGFDLNGCKCGSLDLRQEYVSLGTSAAPRL